MADRDPCAPLCVCGARGCPMAVEHANAMVEPLPLFRIRSRAARRHNRRRGAR